MFYFAGAHSGHLRASLPGSPGFWVIFLQNRPRRLKKLEKVVKSTKRRAKISALTFVQFLQSSLIFCHLSTPAGTGLGALAALHKTASLSRIFFHSGRSFLRPSAAVRLQFPAKTSAGTENSIHSKRSVFRIFQIILC